MVNAGHQALPPVLGDTPAAAELAQAGLKDARRQRKSEIVRSRPARRGMVGLQPAPCWAG